MANVAETQILLDGPRNAVIKLTATLDTADETAVEKVDPATLSNINSNGEKANRVVIDRIEYDVEDGLTVSLLWDATADKDIVHMERPGSLCFADFGGLSNNAGAGVTGKILLTTQGWSTGQVLSYTIVLYLKKRRA